MTFFPGYRDKQMPFATILTSSASFIFIIPLIHSHTCPESYFLYISESSPAFTSFQGISDNLLTCTTRAWDMKKPLLFCPAMNTRMWEHPITKQQVDTLKSWSHVEIPPTSKKLMCGDIGVGAMAEVVHIVQQVINVSGWKEGKTEL